MARRLLVIFALACFGCMADVARAHPMPKSLVFLDIGQREVRAELHLPLDRLEIGFGQPLLPDPAASVARLRPALLRYVEQHIAAVSPDGRRWRTVVRRVTLLPEDSLHALRVDVVLEAPDGASPRVFALHYDVIQHQLITHDILVSLRSDWDAGAIHGEPALLGAMGYGREALEVNRPAGSASRGFASVVRLGMHHIGAGTDHLLFLLVLLLPAPLLARGAHWAEPAPVARAVRHLVAIVTAFTVGHSLTLAVGALGWFRDVEPVVEVLIALSILVSAVHAMRPLFPGREAWVAGGFGLVHGLAFAGVVAGLGLSGSRIALSVLGFNLGIEAMQLVVVAIAVPWLLLLARTTLYTPVRIAGALAAAVAALGWIAERALGWPNRIEPAVERVAAHPWLLVGVLATAAIAGTTLQRRAGGTLTR